MPLAAHKTKIVYTIGPASMSPEIMERMLRAGMNVARLNFSHGDFANHQRGIERIRAVATEPNRPLYRLREMLKTYGRDGRATLADLIALSVENTLERVSPAAVIVPTVSGHIARMISRFKLPVWITAVTPQQTTCQGLQFSYGVYPVHQPDSPGDWKAFAGEWLRVHGLAGNLVILAEGPSPRNPQANHRMEIIDLGQSPQELSNIPR